MTDGGGSPDFGFSGPDRMQDQRSAASTKFTLTPFLPLILQLVTHRTISPRLVLVAASGATRTVNIGSRVRSGHQRVTKASRLRRE
jgi:hypothetical protein